MVSLTYATTRNGTRWSTADAYLRPALDRANLHLITQAHVTRVMFHGKRATGVEFVRNGRLQRVNATNEIILSAGAVGASHILLLSGVGPKWHLDEMHIPVVAELPVGENLLESMGSLSPQILIDKPLTATPTSLNSYWERFMYAIWGGGYYSSPCGIVGSAFVVTDIQQNEGIQVL